MARSRKKTASQKVVGVATSGLPSPVRKLLGGRIIALLLVSVFPVLWATGVVSVGWRNGRPTLSVNRERAAEVRETAREEIQELGDEMHGEPSHGLRPPSSLGLSSAPRSEFSLGLQEETTLGTRVAERVEQLQTNVGRNLESGFQLSPHFGGQDDTPQQAVRPLSQLKDRLEDIR